MKHALRPSAAEPDVEIAEREIRWSKIQGRLRRVEGQVNAVQRMLEERRDCHAIAQQMAAARAALHRAKVQLMTTSMAECLRPNGNVDNDEMTRLTETFVKLLL
jgi:CsoR family transcriptional regulator, copper-sensing transcriptional repressor